MFVISSSAHFTRLSSRPAHMISQSGKPNVWLQMHLFYSSDYQHNSNHAISYIQFYNKAVNTQLSKQIRGLELTVLWWDEFNFHQWVKQWVNSELCYCSLSFLWEFPSFKQRNDIRLQSYTEHFLQKYSKASKEPFHIFPWTIQICSSMLRWSFLVPFGWMAVCIACRRTDAFAIKLGCKCHWSHFRVDCFIPFCSRLILLVHSCVFIEHEDHFCIGRMIFNRAVKDISAEIHVV